VGEEAVSWAPRSSAAQVHRRCTSTTYIGYAYPRRPCVRGGVEQGSAIIGYTGASATYIDYLRIRYPRLIVRVDVRRPRAPQPSALSRALGIAYVHRLRTSNTYRSTTYGICVVAVNRRRSTTVGLRDHRLRTSLRHRTHRSATATYLDYVYIQLNLRVACRFSYVYACCLLQGPP
jgi:hypothetical protein